ncbi:EAL domain-containing protein [Aquisalimonas sp.]|uniref:putative bifunctional diguanylate cyclase/phosphodiesterase n=1 Tax=unclassified Aquisalimonas TaxID=2644645 RepID=UPI0025C0CC92|nr:EAL domain-containing protein [Aquisalimonas sp.]
MATDSASYASVRDGLAGHGGEGFRVEWVTTLADALNRLNRRDVDVVLLSATTPGGDDREAFDLIRRTTPDALLLPLNALGFQDTGPSPSSEQPDASWLADTLRYVVQRKRVEAGLRASEDALFERLKHAEVTLASIGDAVLVTDFNSLVTYLNPVAEAMTGWPAEEAVGRPLGEIFHITIGGTGAKAVDPAQRAMLEDCTVGLEADCVLRRRDGTESGIEDSAAPLHDRHGRVSGAVIVFRDVSQSRKVTRRMAYLARHDALTGLPNRALLKERLGQSIRLADRHGKQAALLYVDLDNFKDINDALGHVVGDQVLKAVAGHLTRCVRASDTVCRHGGDEFVILLSEIATPADAEQVTNKLLNTFASPIEVNGHALQVGLSIGVSIYPDHGDSADALTEHADQAMYRARAISRNGNDTALGQRQASGRPLAESARGDLHRAFDNREFLLHYQPQIDVPSGQIIGVEALVRWLHPVRGLMYPGQFMGLAEQAGLSVPLGRWVIREACQQITTWKASSLWAPLLAVNISALEFSHTRFATELEAILRETGLDAGELELELTEGVLMLDADASVTRLNELRDLGVTLAIDNFGTGPSSLNQLQRFPVHTLKVDGSFVHDINTARNDPAILRSLIGIGKSLKHRVVAEGVETVQQYGFIKAQHCDAAQGFQLGYPLGAEDCTLLLAIRGHLLRCRES